MSRHDILLRLVPDSPDRVLTALAETPGLAHERDEFGYTLLHAAASYGHLDLMRTLVRKYAARVDIVDEDEETPLFYAERLDVVQCLVEELGADASRRNSDGVLAADKMEREGEGAWVAEVVEYLRSRPSATTTTATDSISQIETVLQSETVAEGIPIQDRPALVPENVQINFGTMAELPAAEGADPEIRRKIEELAARGDLDTEAAQAELKTLVTEVVTGMRDDVIEDGRTSQRRRVDE